MKLFLALIFILSIIEVHGMMKKGKKKDVAVYLCFAVITLLFGSFYLANPYRDSLSHIVLSALGIGE